MRRKSLGCVARPLSVRKRTLILAATSKSSVRPERGRHDQAPSSAFARPSIIADDGLTGPACRSEPLGKATTIKLVHASGLVWVALPN
jgi:hypothetical protein